MKKFLIFSYETIKIVIISLLIIIPLKFFIVQPFFVRGASMEPNFENGDYLIVNELVYHFSSPKRGDVVVFKFPLDPSQYYIKRIIGLPGETVEIKNGQVIIYNNAFPQGMILDESMYLRNEETKGDLKVTLDENDYFVLGDNRQASADSRIWGLVPQHYIVGRVWLRAWPFDKAQAFASINYQLIKN